MELSHDKRAAIAECGAAAGATEYAIRKWFQRGVPGKWHLPLLRLARERGVDLSEDDLLATSASSGR